MKRAAATAAARAAHPKPEVSPLNGMLGCNGKRQYPDYSNAAKVAKTQSRRHDSRVQPYRCTHCRRWHLGTPNLKTRGYGW